MESDAGRITDHANRRESIMKGRVVYGASTEEGKKEEKKCDALSALSLVFVREQSFFLHRVACQPMDLLVSK